MKERLINELVKTIICYHYRMENFKVPESELEKPEYDDIIGIDVVRELKQDLEYIKNSLAEY
jgi:hypothetical protein